VALVEPEIPQNAGNIARLCAATGTPLHLIGPLGFRITDRDLKRAGVDCWESVLVRRHRDFDSFLDSPDCGRVFLFSKKGERLYTSADYRPGDTLVFGSESRGLPEGLLRAHGDRVLAIPIRAGAVRSLNLATAVGIALYEALRRAAEPAP
jgi:tRNA (cytidine/uridine-2'-O-)-methyltransferase